MVSPAVGTEGFLLSTAGTYGQQTTGDMQHYGELGEGFVFHASQGRVTAVGSGWGEAAVTQAQTPAGRGCCPSAPLSGRGWFPVWH